MQHPSHLQGRATQSRLASGLCNGARPARAAFFPRNSVKEGQSHLLREENVQISLPGNPTSSKERMGLRDKQPEHRKGNPGASSRGSLEHSPPFHLFFSNLPTLKFPSDSCHQCRHVGFNVAPSGSTSLVKIPLGWTDTQLLSRTFPFFQPKEAKAFSRSAGGPGEQPRGAGEGLVTTHRVPLRRTLSHSGCHFPRI